MKDNKENNISEGTGIVKEYGQTKEGNKYEKFYCWSFLIGNVETKTHNMKHVANENQVPLKALFPKYGAVVNFIN